MKQSILFEVQIITKHIIITKAANKVTKFIRFFLLKRIRLMGKGFFDEFT